MQYSYGNRLDKLQFVSWIESEMETSGPRQDNTIEFLLTVQPLLHRYSTAALFIARNQFIAHPIGKITPQIQQALDVCEQVHQEFLQRFSPSDALRTPIETYPIVCDSCGALSSFVDVHKDATLVCVECGMSIRYYIAHGRNALSHMDQLIRAPASYTYQPIKYFRKILEETQGIHHGRLPPKLISDLQHDLKIHSIKIHEIRPELIYASLKRLRQPQYYPCRWALTKRLNPYYTPIRMPDDLIDQLFALFQGMITRFPSVIKKLGLRRKNLPSIPYFAKDSLLYLGYPHFAKEFSALKSLKRHRIQTLILKIVFISLNVSPHHTHPIPDLPIQGKTVPMEI